MIRLHQRRLAAGALSLALSTATALPAQNYIDPGTRRGREAIAYMEREMGNNGGPSFSCDLRGLDPVLNFNRSSSRDRAKSG